MSIDAWMQRLREQAARPLEDAESLPPELYVRPDVYAREVERIFEKDWMCVGRVDQVPNPGDWLRIDLVGEPLILTRDAGGTLRALSRVCRHRAMDMLAGTEERSGNATRLECPYHLWTYRLDGRLSGAPEMRGAQRFERATCALPEVPLEIWQGFVFVCLDPSAPPLAPRLRRLERFLGAIDMSEWRIAGTVPWGEVGVNWKVAIENGAECYHHLGTHRDSLQPIWPASTVIVDETSGSDFFVGRMIVSERMAAGEVDGFRVQPTLLPVVPGLTPEQRSQTLLIGVFPMFFMTLGPDAATFFEWLPTGPESHHLDIHVLVPPTSFAAPGFDAGLQAMLQALHDIQGEDARVNLGVQRGLRARLAAPGPLSPLERPLWQLQRYLAARLVDA